MDRLDRYIKALWDGYGLVGVVSVVVLAAAVITWAAWMGWQVEDVLRWVS